MRAKSSGCETRRSSRHAQKRQLLQSRHRVHWNIEKILQTESRDRVSSREPGKRRSDRRLVRLWRARLTASSKQKKTGLVRAVVIQWRRSISILHNIFRTCSLFRPRARLFAVGLRLMPASPCILLLRTLLVKLVMPHASRPPLQIARRARAEILKAPSRTRSYGRHRKVPPSLLRMNSSPLA